EVGSHRGGRQSDVLHPGDPAGHPRLPPAGPGTGDPGRRPGEPPVEKGHAHDGRHGDRRGHRVRLPRRPPVPRRPAGLGVQRHRDPAALPDGRDGHGRLPRRLPQDPAPPQPGAEQDGQAGRATGRRGELRRDGDQLPGQRDHPGLDSDLLRPRHRAADAGLHRVRDPGLPVHRRLLQRRQPHRRAGRAGRGLLGDGVRLLPGHLLLAVHPRLRQRADPGLLRGARPVRRHAGRGRGHGRLPGLPVVEHQPGADLHGRHRFAGAGRPDLRAGHRHPHRAATRRPRWAVRRHHALGGDPGGLLPGDPAPGLPDGAAAPPLRARRVDGEHRHRPVLAGHRDGRGLRAGAVLRGLAELRRIV
ncbi:MAG: Phospho-N-acetylmuramoyl-pentapeptide-transferase, partial [uncultured Blastococcus sp.]